MNLYYKIKNAICEFWFDFRARCQRFKYGYSYNDIYDMDIWFVNTVKPMLIYLRDHGTGIPGDLYSSDYENEREDWEIVLTEMINCLDKMDIREAYAVTNKDRKNAHKILQSNKNRFFELFSKYFYNLWE